MKDAAAVATKECDVTEAKECDVTDGSKAWSSVGFGSHLFVRRVMQIVMLLIGFGVLWTFLNKSASPLEFPAISHHFIDNSSKINGSKLESVLRNACMKDKTVIVTNLNNAWAEPGSIFDLFLESFRVGNQTKKLLNHLVVITWDQKAYTRCLSLHKHCYQIETKGDNFTSEAFFMTPTYLHMVWRKIEVLGSILQMGYNFVFTDNDIMWLRDPFIQFYKDTDIQISCDSFNGNSYDMKNFPNSGFHYVKSNDRTIWFYKLWFNSRETYPKLHDQDVLNKIKRDPLVSKKKLKIRFLSTNYFGGFCEPSKDFKKVSTMHANCCVGVENKVNDLRILIEDWRKYMALSEDERNISQPSWSVPQSCRTSFQRSRQRRHI
ncbi:uncharacterized protein At4g15970-like [Lotus japonicus]|uniref:uncharacterized protein At4g15970-like n=1 Tax=Lotus japonicus TaxID=34305 RepID=UPI002582CC96|nr:uncharacterized protein At4g15970-like [Lotus japonicus]